MPTGTQVCFWFQSPNEDYPYSDVIDLTGPKPVITFQSPNEDYPYSDSIRDSFAVLCA